MERGLYLIVECICEHWNLCLNAKNILLHWVKSHPTPSLLCKFFSLSCIIQQRAYFAWMRRESDWRRGMLKLLSSKEDSSENNQLWKFSFRLLRHQFTRTLLCRFVNFSSSTMPRLIFPDLQRLLIVCMEILNSIARSENVANRRRFTVEGCVYLQPHSFYEVSPEIAQLGGPVRDMIWCAYLYSF